jgi:hypothetical protein
MDGRARVSAPRGSRRAVVTIAVAVVLAFIPVVVSIPNVGSQIPDGMAHACTDYIQRSASNISSPLCRGLTCNKARPALAVAETNSWQVYQVATGLNVRLVGHAAGHGAGLTQVQLAAGWTWGLAAAEPNTGDREAQPKERAASRRCQICRAEVHGGVSQAGPEPEATL